MSALAEFDALVEKAKEQVLWEDRLGMNELLYGSAYGPWLPPREFTGLVSIIGA
jgi:hypothetical protein